MGLMGSNRQLIALAICIYSMRYIVEKTPVKFFISILLAVNFHITAILFVVYYFINSEIKPRTIIIILGSTLIIGRFNLPILSFSYMANLFGGNTETKALMYLNGIKTYQALNNPSIFGLVKRILFLAVFYYNRKRISEKLAYYNLMLNGYIIGLAFYFMFASSLLIVVSRGSVFFNIMEPLLIASQLCIFKKKGNVVILLLIALVFSILFLFQSIRSYPDLFLPYKGIFINSDFQRRIPV
jgi:hypothetical protein